MKAQPRARDAHRVPRTPVGMLFDKGAPSPSLRYVAGKVTDTNPGNDSCTCLVNGEEIPRIAVLGNMPAVNDLVDIYQLDDLLYLPAGGTQCYVQPDEPSGPVGTLWFDTDEVRP